MENPAFEIEGCCGTIVFDNPERRNPLSRSVLERLETLIKDETVGLEKLVFTGVGDIFAAGANIREVSGLNSKTAIPFSRLGQSVFSSIRKLPATTIAAINGHCIGGALDLALSCDIRIAVPDAVFAHPGARLGIITGWGGTQMLPELVGRKRAFEMFLTAKKVSAEEALGIGLIDEISIEPVRRAREYEA